MTTLPVPDPRPDEETEPFWRATGRGELLLQRCTRCDRISWPMRSFCPHCGAPALVALTASGRGEVYSYTVVRKASGAWQAATPYVVGYVELAEGPRILTNIVGCVPEEVRVGLPVELRFARAANGFAVYRFVPAAQQS
jgi:uncharacterized OB-fold protein